MGLKWNVSKTVRHHWQQDRFLWSSLEVTIQHGIINIKQPTPLLDFHEKQPPSNRVWIKTKAGKVCHLMNRNQWKITTQAHPLYFFHSLNLADPVLICAKPSHKTQDNEEHLGVQPKQYDSVLWQPNDRWLLCVYLKVDNAASISLGLRLI